MNKREKTHWMKPYQENGRQTLTETGSGVYLIKKNDEIVYIGYSNGAIKKTLYRHFQTWTDKRSQFTQDREGFDRVSYAGQNLDQFRVRVIFTNNAVKAYELETKLINKYKPIQNRSKLRSLFEDEYNERIKKIEEAKSTDIFDEIDEFFNIPKFNPNDITPF